VIQLGLQWAAPLPLAEGRYLPRLPATVGYLAPARLRGRAGFWICIPALEIASSFTMNFKNRAIAVLVMAAIYNLMAYSMWGDEFRTRDLETLHLILGFAMGWTGFGMMYRLGGYFASPFAKLQKYAFGLWILSIFWGILGLPGGFIFIIIAGTLVLVQYTRFFIELPKKEMREILYLNTVILASCLGSLALLHVISNLVVICVLSWLLCFVAIEYLYSQWKNPDSSKNQGPQGNPYSNAGDSGNPFDKPL
jgi:hypothetical protein